DDPPGEDEIAGSAGAAIGRSQSGGQRVAGGEPARIHGSTLTRAESLDAVVAIVKGRCHFPPDSCVQRHGGTDFPTVLSIEGTRGAAQVLKRWRSLNEIVRKAQQVVGDHVAETGIVGSAAKKVETARRAEQGELVELVVTEFAPELQSMAAGDFAQ